MISYGSSRLHTFLQPLRLATLAVGLGGASLLGAAEVQLQWEDNSTNETGFKIERALGSGSFVQIATVGANVVTYRDTGLADGAQYQYRVRAYNGAGHSAYSNFAAITTPIASTTTNLPANTAPTVSTIAAQTISPGTATSILAFTIGDAETSAASLGVTRSSSNTTVIPTANVILGGSGANRTLTVTSLPGVTGSSTIAIDVSDGALTTRRTFTVTVAEPVNTPPTISALGSRSIPSNGTTGAISFTIGDQQTVATSLTLSATSSNTTLVPLSGVQLGGSGSSRTVSVTPAAGRTGTATITVTVSDGRATASSALALTVTNSAPTILSVMDQTIQRNGSGDPIPVRIGDAETAAGSLTVTATSNNATLLPASSLVLGGTGANRTLTLLPPAFHSGTGTVTLSVSDGSLRSTTSFNVQVITGNDGAYIATHPVSRLVRSGATATFSVRGFGSPTPTYQWRRNGVPISGATSPTLTISNVSSTHAAVYDVLVRTPTSSKTSQPAVLLVNPSSTVGTTTGSFVTSTTYANWSMLVRNNRTALLLTSIPSTQQTLAVEVELAADGSCTVVHSAVGAYVPLR